MWAILHRNNLREAAQKSCDVLMNMGPQIQWVHSYVTDNKIILHLSGA